MEKFLGEEGGDEEEPPSLVTRKVSAHSEQLKLEDYLEIGKKEIAQVISEVINKVSVLSKPAKEVDSPVEEVEESSLEQEVLEEPSTLNFEDYSEMSEEVSKIVYGLIENRIDFSDYGLSFLAEIHSLVGDAYRNTLYMKGGDESVTQEPVALAPCEQPLIDIEIDISAHLQDRALDKNPSLYSDISDGNTEDRSEEQRAWQTFVNRFDTRLLEIGIRSYFQQVVQFAKAGNYN